VVNRESLAFLEEVKIKMRRENEHELDPELLSPLQTLEFMVDVMRKADESVNLRQILINSEEFIS
jgi:hypothetical protein